MDVIKWKKGGVIMATKDEQRAAQADHYYSLLAIKARNADYDIKGLDEEIGRIRAKMLEPEVAWVEKQINEAYK